MSKHGRWIWVVLVENAPLRQDSSGLWKGSFGTGFASYEQARTAMLRQRATYYELRERCRIGGSEIGVDSWNRRAESIRIARIELAEAR